MLVLIARSRGMIGMMVSTSGWVPSTVLLSAPLVVSVPLVPLGTVVLSLGLVLSPPPPGWGVLVSSGAGDAAGEERGVASASSGLRCARVGLAASLLEVTAGEGLGLAFSSAAAVAEAWAWALPLALMADGMLSVAYLRTWS